MAGWKWHLMLLAPRTVGIILVRRLSKGRLSSLASAASAGGYGACVGE
jgi:hypothetical protein